MTELLIGESEHDINDLVAEIFSNFRQFVFFFIYDIYVTAFTLPLTDIKYWPLINEPQGVFINITSLMTKTLYFV